MHRLSKMNILLAPLSHLAGPKNESESPGSQRGSLRKTGGFEPVDEEGDGSKDGTIGGKNSKDSSKIMALRQLSGGANEKDDEATVNPNGSTLKRYKGNSSIAIKRPKSLLLVSIIIGI